MILSSDQPRIQELFGFDWFFRLGDISPEDAFAGGAGWTAVSLPHDWSRFYDFDKDNPCLGSGGYVKTGIGWYRKAFTVDSGVQSRMLYLAFDGVYMNASVWVNGHYLGRHIYGYTPFEFDITPYVQYGGENIVAVKVDNTAQPNSRWFSGSGITRDVFIKILSPIHVVAYGSQITLIESSEAAAAVSIRTTVENCGEGGSCVMLSTVIFDADGQRVTNYAGEKGVFVEGSCEYEQILSFKTPKYWSVETPYLYECVTKLIVNGRVIDEYRTRFGVRALLYDKRKGFFLNGKHVKINGGAVHHDGGCLGAAVPKKIWERRLKKLKEAGFNGIRTAHNPPDPALLDACDELGFLVMDEVFDEWNIVKNTKSRDNTTIIPRGYGEWFTECHTEDMEIFLRRDRNHPSVIMWSIGNEIPEQIELDGHLIARELQDSCHRLDPTRLVTAGCDFIAAEPRAATLNFLNELDIVGYNYVDRWGTRCETFYEDDRIDHPDWLQIGAENGNVCGGIRGQNNLAATGNRLREGPYYNLPVSGAKLLRFTMTRDYVIGDYMWTAIDYLGEARWPFRSASSGQLDTAGFAKDSFYFYKSIWNREVPTVHLLPHWNIDVEEGTIIPVLCYTSCDYVELFLNGKSYGRKAFAYPCNGNPTVLSDKHHVYTNTDDLFLSWDVPYIPGTIEAVGYRDGAEVCRHSMKTASAPAKIEAVADTEKLTADGRDICHIEMRILDKDGNFIPVTDDFITVDVSGAGLLIGFDNGSPTDLDLFKTSHRRVFNGMALAIVQAAREGGEIDVTVSAPGLTGVKIKLQAE